MKYSRFWTFKRDEWTPGPLAQWGLPHQGGDEWGRRVITVGFWFLGYLNFAWRTCWCDECHQGRLQTYGFLYEQEQERIYRSVPRPLWQYGLPTSSGRIVGFPGEPHRITDRLRRRLLVPIGDWESVPNEPEFDGKGGADG